MKTDIYNFLNKIHIIYIIINVLLIVLTVICLFYATLLYIGFMICSVLLIGLCITFRALYLWKVRMGIVYEIAIMGQTVTLKTKKQEYSYDLDGGSCQSVKAENRKFVCTFVTESGKDVLTFYRYLPFSGYRNVQFTKEELTPFCPLDAFRKTKGGPNE